jgi:glucan phosphoethanolaminetransferase (alkaline phosphatase superfamily)
LHNSINVFSFYFARMAGREYEVSRPPFKPYAVRKMAVQSESPNNIVLLLVDSLRHDRLQISGYHRPNTPFLQTLQSAKSLQMRTGLASSVATGSSLPLFFNVVREPGNIDMINQNKANLFRHAKLSGYKTFWLSTQESKVLHGLGAQSFAAQRGFDTCADASMGKHRFATGLRAT